MKKNTIITTVLLALCLLFAVAPAHAASSQEAGQTVAALSAKIDINTATVDGLTALPGIGKKTAERIVNFRKENGNFGSPEDIMQVKGIGQKKYEKLKTFVTTS